MRVQLSVLDLKGGLIWTQYELGKKLRLMPNDWQYLTSWTTISFSAGSGNSNA
jgi:hypothetical protein